MLLRDTDTCVSVSVVCNWYLCCIRYWHLCFCQLYIIVCYSDICVFEESASLRLPCLMTTDSGPCRAYKEYFYYNATTQQCESFIYGGCDGTANRFVTVEHCTEYCQPGIRTWTRRNSLHIECFIIELECRDSVAASKRKHYGYAVLFSQLYWWISTAQCLGHYAFCFAIPMWWRSGQHLYFS